MTPEQREISEACGALLEALDSNVPHYVVHYAVEEARVAVERLHRILREGPIVRTFDTYPRVQGSIETPAPQ